MRNFKKYLLAGVLSVGAASAGSMTGWISDSTCGASNGNGKKESRDCTEQCLKNGADAVFVSESDNKVYKLAGNVKTLKSHLQHKVQITGDVKNDTLTVKEIQKAN